MRRFLIAALLLTGCQAEPRAASYFEAHPEQAQRIVAACRTGDHRGQECANAEAGLAAARANKRLELFKKSFE
ncbi:EexN family lipoprotein [Phenylobacterium sp.]|uniref:EexN family lipoprotein n=1 Tax=Phenylobacterium sp. TaxID=1871053 RepID=UPI0039532569